MPNKSYQIFIEHLFLLDIIMIKKSIQEKYFKILLKFNYQILY